jgi:hypothetical protein
MFKSLNIQFNLKDFQTSSSNTERNFSKSKLEFAPYLNVNLFTHNNLSKMVNLAIIEIVKVRENLFYFEVANC